MRISQGNYTRTKFYFTTNDKKIINDFLFFFYLQDILGVKIMKNVQKNIINKNIMRRGKTQKKIERIT